MWRNIGKNDNTKKVFMASHYLLDYIKIMIITKHTFYKSYDISLILCYCDCSFGVEGVPLTETILYE